MTKHSEIKLDDEAGRVAALRRYAVYDTSAQHWFDEIVALVKSIFSVPFAAITLIDQDQLWTKATAGSDAAILPREGMFCEYTIGSVDTFSVEDTALDPRFSDAPSVTSNGMIRCYFGAPLTTPDGYNLGALCIFGIEPRTFSEGEHVILRNFAKVVVSQIELRQAASQDSLTGAMTRRAFHDELAEVVAKGKRASLLMVDVDHFKSINDTYGHPAGDETLCAVAACLRGGAGSVKRLGRLGGEEFGILLYDADLEKARDEAESLMAQVASLNIPAVADRRVTISIGIAAAGKHASVGEWLSSADEALYDAKRTGRNKAVART